MPVWLRSHTGRRGGKGRAPETPSFPGNALLAQLVEHLHGKEGVSSLSLLEGSQKAPHLRRFSCSWDDPIAGSDWKLAFGVFPQCPRTMGACPENRVGKPNRIRLTPSTVQKVGASTL